MKKLTFILATALMMTACATNVEKQAEVPAIDINNFDEAIDKKADFYQWATGGWQKNNPLKPEFSRYGSFDVLRENNAIGCVSRMSWKTQQVSSTSSTRTTSKLYRHR